MISRIISAFVVIAVGTSLLPEVARQVQYRGSPIIIEKKERSQKQTYLDYVQERLEVERLMR